MTFVNIILFSALENFVRRKYEYLDWIPKKVLVRIMKLFIEDVNLLTTY